MRPVINIFLDALGVVAGRHQGTRLPRPRALLQPGCLGQSLAVSLDTIDHNPPLAGCVDRSQGRDISSQAGAQVGLLRQLDQSVHAIVRVS